MTLTRTECSGHFIFLIDTLLHVFINCQLENRLWTIQVRVCVCVHVPNGKLSNGMLSVSDWAFRSPLDHSV